MSESGDNQEIFSIQNLKSKIGIGYGFTNFENFRLRLLACFID